MIKYKFDYTNYRLIIKKFNFNIISYLNKNQCFHKNLSLHF